jgi:chloramphenicol-sensitive protein RarD
MPAAEPSRAAFRGVMAAGACYLLWGLLPLYWRQLASIDARELIAHRIVWSGVFVAAITSLSGGWKEVRTAFGSARLLALNLLSSVLLTANWLVYVWSVNHGHILETSLGYFLLPLVNVALGRLVLHEHLRPTQWLAIAVAALGVALQVLQAGRLPWIALTLAATFGSYGLLRKRSTLGSLTGLTVETALLTPAALAYLAWCHYQGTGALGRADWPTQGWVLCAGAITAVPLLLFAYGARRIRLTTLGLLQYLSPSVSFCLGVLVYHEAFGRDRFVSFALIWLGLALYTADNLRAFARSAR